MVCDYTYDDKNQTMRINCLGCIYGASIEDSEVCMGRIIEKLFEVKKVSKIVLAETREYEYDYPQVKLLVQLADAIQEIMRKRLISLENISVKGCDKCVPTRYAFLRNLVDQIKYDPLNAYKQLIREIRHVKVRLERSKGICQECYSKYLRKALLPMKEILDRCEIFELAKDVLDKPIKDRSFYREIFHPTIRPNFMYTYYLAIPPENAELVYRYKVGESIVEIFRLPGKVRYLYHMLPPEFRLEEDEYTILDAARRYLAAHQPRRPELSDPKTMRETFYNISKDLVSDLANRHGVRLSSDKIDLLARILTRYTAGFGILELLLADEKIQDISVNSPIGRSPIYIFHNDFEECETNLIPSREDAESWATRLRLLSGRPLDEANPVLDTELFIPGGHARVCSITRTLSPTGLAFALRRHRERPWTFPLFVSNRMINPFTAGLLWFLVDNGRSILIAGTRSSGKTSLLGAMMLQIMRKSRIVTLEDTLELPVRKLRELGYNIEQLKSRSVITQVEIELPADEALRTALRLGDSCLIVGEVRSVEAKALYEAMRIGALANVVAGTIHGDSPYGVYDRVVNDLGVPSTSFKATDIIVIANRLRSPDGLTTFRRVIQLTEVRKHWRDDPLSEGGFVNLLEYHAKEDELRPTETLSIGESFVLNEIASRVREWKGRWDKVWDNIMLRSKIMKTLAEYGKKNPEILEAEFVVKSNDQFHLISSKVLEEFEELDSNEIYKRWLEWLKSSGKHA